MLILTAAPAPILDLAEVTPGALVAAAEVFVDSRAQAAAEVGTS